MIREPALAPPPGFRPHMSLKVKLQSLLLHGPIFDENGNRVVCIEDLEWDHVPALQLRVWDPVAGDTIPAANDPEYIVPSAKAVHRKKTAKQDVPQIAKTRRRAKSHQAFREAVLAKEPGEKRKRTSRIASRPLKSRNTLQKKQPHMEPTKEKTHD